MTLAECTLVLSLEVIFASIAVLLGVLSITTHRSIRHLGVGKSFWIPVFVSSVFFLIGSAFAVLFEMGFSLASLVPVPFDAVQVSQVSRILAICILFIGVYSYSRTVRTILPKESTAKQAAKEKLKIQFVSVEDKKMEAPVERKRTLDERIQESPKTKTAPKCKHQFGYLRTLPKDTPIPDECFSCDRIIACKHALVKTLEPPT